MSDGGAAPQCAPLQISVAALSSRCLALFFTKACVFAAISLPMV
jgi:hypothetical protein